MQDTLLGTTDGVGYIDHCGVTKTAYIVATAGTINPPAPDETEAAVLAKYGYPAKHRLADGITLADGEVILAIVEQGGHRWSAYLRKAMLDDVKGVFRRSDSYRVTGGYTSRDPGGDLCQDADED